MYAYIYIYIHRQRQESSRFVCDELPALLGDDHVGVPLPAAYIYLFEYRTYVIASYGSTL